MVEQVDQLTALLERQVAELVAELAAHNESLQRQSDLLEKARREWNAATREKDARIAALEGALRLCRETLKEARDHLTPRDAFGDVGDNCLRAEEAARAALEASHE